MSLETVLMRFDSAGFVVMKHLLTLSWQFLILFTAAFVLAALMKCTSARIRYTIWMSVFYLIPVSALLVFYAARLDTPNIEVQIIPSYSNAIQPVVMKSPAPAPAEDHMTAIKTGRINILAFPWMLAGVAYVVGAAVFLGLVGLGRYRMSKWLKRGRTVNDFRMTSLFHSTARHMNLRRPCRCVESRDINVPFTVGTFRPSVLIPSGYADNLADSELRALFLHELAHVKRLDSLVFSYVSVLRAVFFFNPLVWYAARQVSVLAENACDDAVIEADSNPLDYAELLVRLARHLPEHALTTELAAGFILSKHSFLNRVKQILSDKKRTVTRLPKWAMAGCFASAIAILGIVVAVPAGEVREADTATAKNVIFTARVIDSETKKPVEGVRLFVGRNKLEIQGISDRTGALEISNLERGKLRFWVEGKGIGRWWSEESLEYQQRNKPNTAIVTHHALRDFDPISFDMAPGMKTVTIMVEKGVTVSGTVFDPDGNPVQGATVAGAVTGHGTSIAGDTRYSVMTDSRGRYKLLLPSSKNMEFNLVAHDGAFMEWRNWANGITKPMKTIPGQVVNNLDITLTRPGTVRGTVVDTSGKPKAGQDVRAHAADGMGNHYYDPMTKTDENGNFVLPCIRPGEHWIIGVLTIVAVDEVRDYAPQDVMRNVTVASGQTIDNIKLVGYGRDELLKAMKPK